MIRNFFIEIIGIYIYIYIYIYINRAIYIYKSYIIPI